MPARILVVLLVQMLLFACTATGGVYHRVLPGQTLYSISRTYGVNERYLARINDIDDPAQLKAGRQLYIPGANQVRRVPVTVQHGMSDGAGESPSRRGRTSPPPATAAVAPKRQATVKRPASPPAKSGTSARDAHGQRPHFIWPIHGKLLKRFGSRSGGGLCKGVEIATAPGATVLAAAAGKVIYSGDGISGYGNLIIVRHDDSFFTVYGFNRKNLVSSGAFVSKGQHIALAGVPPKGGSARLYFEIRHGKKPVNPIFYLP